MPRIDNPDHLGQVALDNFAEEPDKICQVDADTGETETRGSLRQRAIRTAQHMSALGLRVGDVFSVCSHNTNDSSLPLVAGWQIGATCNGIDMGMSKLEYAHMLKLTKPKIIFCDPEKLDTFVEVAKVAQIDPIIVVFGDAPDKRCKSFKEFYQNDYDVENYTPVEFDVTKVLAYIICSSGSTGLPKGVCHTHQSAARTVRMLKPEFSHLKMVQFGSIYWISALMMTVVNLTCHTLKINSRPCNPERFYKNLKQHQFQFLTLTPSAIRQLIKSPEFENADFSSIVMFMVAGAAVDLDDLNKLKKKLTKGIILNSYGLSEAGGPLTYIPKDVPFKDGSVGRILPNVERKIIDVETKEEVKEPNKLGELYIRTDKFMCGYYNDPDSTAEAMSPDGWFASGDLVRIDEDGFMFIIDRLKDVFKYMGYGIAPATLESVINSHPAVAESVVIGITNKDSGHVPMAFVKPKEGASITAEEIQDIIKENLANYCELRGGVVFVDSFEMTPSGKLKRNALRKLAEVKNNNNI